MESQKLSSKEYIIYGSMGLFLLLSVVLYVFEFRQFERLLQTSIFVLSSATIGAILGVYIGWRFQRNTNDITDKVQIYVFFILIFAIFAPLWTSILNRVLAFGSERVEKVELWEQNPYYSSRGGLIIGEELKPTGYYTFLLLNDELIRLESKQLIYPNNRRGDTVSLVIKNGFLGMPYILQKSN